MESPTIDTYQVGIICALPKELRAVRAVLDEEYKPLKSQDAQDHNSYVLGRIGEHNVVAAGLPAGVYGTTSAASVSSDMLRTFPQLRFGLLVGIGGGVPNVKAGRDIRLGDVVVSQPSATYGGVVQYDMGKLLNNGEFELKGSLNKPPQLLLTALTNLQASLGGSPIAKHLKSVDQKYPSLKDSGYSSPGPSQDRLHCTKCDPARWWWILWVLVTWLWPLWRCDECDNGEIRRKFRSNETPAVHYGTIASANTLLRNAQKRDQLGREIDPLCVEMEAAGLMDNFPCLVIRGICDYADANSNDLWQEWAALTAAALAKELLLEYISPQATKDEEPVRKMIDHLDRHFQLQEAHDIQQQAHNQRQEAFNERQEGYQRDERYQECHRAFDVTSYEDQKQRNHVAVEGTCQWVLKHTQYERWLASAQDDLLWISADPGCGKSVLSRMLIDKHLLVTSRAPITLCYFFFKDNDEQDSLAKAFCAILHQIFTQQPELLRHALPAFERKKTDTLAKDVYELWRILRLIANDGDVQPIICVLDALDECCDADRQLLIGLLCQFCDESMSQPKRQRYRVKWLVTSRPHDDIQQNFSRLRSSISSIRLHGEDENDQIRREIDLVIEARMLELSLEFGLSQTKMEEVIQLLRSMENRTYLWLHLVIDDIRSTFNAELITDQAEISTLPPTVDAAYERILRRISNTKEKHNARKILTVVIGARRPLTVGEMALALGLTLSAKTPSSLADFQIDVRRLGDKIRRWCGLFVFINHDRLYLIHQTAKEFLLNHSQGLIADPNCWKHCLRPLEINIEMAELCILFLCLSDFNGGPITWEDKDIDIWSFLHFASENWADYTRTVEADLNSQTMSKVRSLYSSKSPRCRRWTSIVREKEHLSTILDFPTGDIQLASFNGHVLTLEGIISNNPRKVHIRDASKRTALYWASSKGHIAAVRILLQKGADVNARHDGPGCAIPSLAGNDSLQEASRQGHVEVVQTLLYNGADVNAQGGYYHNALQAASARGHIEVVKILLNQGADVNAHGGRFDSALQAASVQGHLQVVQALLDRGANVNTQGGHWSSPSQAALMRGHIEIVQALLNNGADVNAQDDYYGSFLQAASAMGYVTVVQTLLDRGANINDQSGEYGSALQAASVGGHLQIVKMLLEKGANVNAQGGRYGYALLAASEQGHVEIVHKLLDAGADIDAQGSAGDDALTAAANFGRNEVAQALLENGVDVDAKGGRYGNALQTAAARGHAKVVQTLIDNGADVNAQGGRYSNALQAASRGGFEIVVRTLLDSGARLEIRGGHYGNALQAASARGHAEVVQMLINGGAEIDAHGGEYGNSLYAASERGHGEVVNILLDSGANINAQCCNYGSALQIASAKGHLEIVRALIEKGAWINVQNEDGNALEMASEEGQLEVIHALLNKGANVNAQGGPYGNALQAASRNGHEKVVQLLLNAGADPSVQGGYYGNALQAAARGGHATIVQMLFDAGVDAGASGGRYGNALQAAIKGGYRKVVQMLIDSGANLTIQEEHYNNFRAASSEGDIEI